MNATPWYVARRQLRRGLPSTAAIALLVALSSGSVMALVAGAARSEEALPRFVAAARPASDVAVFAQVDEQIPWEADDQSALLPLLADIPAVAGARRGTMLIVEGTSATGVTQRLLAAAPIDGRREQIFGRPMVVEGAWPEATDPDAIAIDEELAARASLRVGDTYRVAPFTVRQFGPAGEGSEIEPAGPARDLRVSAVYRYPGDLQATELDQEGIYVDQSSLEVTPAYWDAYGPDLARYGVAASVVLADGSRLADLESALTARIPGRFMFEQPSEVGASDGALRGIEQAIALQADGMRLVGLVTAVTGVGLLGLVLGRRGASARRRDGVLSGLGLTARDRVALHVWEGAIIGLAGAVGGVAIAVTASAAMSFGLAGRAELDRGVQLDAPVLAVGALTTVAAVMLCTALAGRRTEVHRSVPARDRWAALAVLGPVAGVGLRFVLQPDGRRRGVPVRAAVAGVATATGVVVAVAVAGASLALVGDEPVRHGVYGDAVVGNLASVEAADAAATLLEDNPDIAGFNGETVNAVPVRDELLLVSAYFDGPGDLWPVVTEGRLPVGDDEIALGAVAMARLGVGIGDVIEMSLSGAPVALEIVGTALVDDVDGRTGGPGKGGITAEGALRRLDPRGIETTGPTWFVVRFAPGVDPAAAVERLRADFPRSVVTARLPADLRNIERLGGLALLLAVLVGALGAGTALLALLGAVSRRRQDLAVLRTLGFVRRQAAVTVSMQATAFAAAGLLFGIPLGVVVGRLVWLAVADDIGIEPAPIVPAGVLLLVGVAVLGAMNLVATLPAHRAWRLRPSEILRAE